MKRTFACILAALFLCSACARAPEAPLEQTAEPTSTPQPTAEPIQFLWEAGEDLLPDAAEGAYHLLGTDMDLDFSVYSNYPITGISLALICSRSENEIYPFGLEASMPVTVSENMYSVSDTESYAYRYTTADLLSEYSLLYMSAESSTQEKAETMLPDAPLNDILDLSLLQTGIHTLSVSICAGGEWRELFEGSFYVLSDTWEQIGRADFDGGYQEAIAFFGDIEKFCYRYQWVEGRYIVVDPLWEQEYIVALPFFTERDWLVHTDAVPYYLDAKEYLENGYVRVSGTNGDSGILRLSELICSYNGSYVARFNSQKTMISAHAFGTASDVNAALLPNANARENKELIAAEVGNLLAYNGISEEDGQRYYDFTYSGEYTASALQIPDTIINYLLYELAFYRAGFQWGYYYKGTSDAMHFCLPSEQVTYSHDGEGSLRKVFEYGDFVLAEDG